MVLMLLLRLVWFLQNQNKRCVYILFTQLSGFSVHVGLLQSSPWTLILFVVFTDTVSVFRRRGSGLRTSGSQLCFFADDVVLLVSSDQDLKHELGQFSASFNVSSSQSETMVLNQKRVECDSGWCSGGVQITGSFFPER